MRAPNKDEVYQRLQPVLQTLEEERKRLVAEFWRTTAIVLLIVGGVGIVLFSWLGAMAVGIAIFAALIGVLFAVSLVQNQWRQNFKQHALTPLIQMVNPNLRYFPNQYIPQTEYHLSMLFHNSPDPDRYQGEDYIEGVIGKTDIRLSELHTEYRQVTYDSKGNRREHWVTIFRGLFVSADFHKEFQGITLVLPDIEQRVLGGLGQWLQNLSAKIGNQPGELVKLEDPEFERLFKVFSTDQIEARYILTPSLMARILDFQKRHSHPIRLSFIASRVFIAIPTYHNYLEPPFVLASAKRIADPEILEHYLHELDFILGIVDELNLNTRIWTKR